MCSKAHSGIYGLSLFILVTSACSSGGSLEPAYDARAVAGLRGAAVAAENEIEVIAQTRVWPGDVRIFDVLEPVRVRIANSSKTAVQVRYEHFRLVAPDGEVFGALAPLSARGEPASKLRRTVITPRFEFTSYRVAPYYDHTFCGIRVYDGPFAFHRASYAASLGILAKVLLSPEMLEWALPEGVLRSGGYVDAYLYFPRVPRDIERVRFEAILTASDPRASRSRARSASASAETPVSQSDPHEIASISIPFAVD
jgi:hypothetical protein